ncbi:UNVERIFIED_CONTAM: MucB/RseB C-terminal domain-containing protein [Spiribacter pallidus]|jgi:sigma-E factor negative regulatory protein RseB
MMPRIERLAPLAAGLVLGALAMVQMAAANDAAQANGSIPQTASGWIERGSEARSRYSFVGDLVYQHADEIETMRIWRSANPETGVRERLHSLSGDAREILRGDDRITCILPNSDSILVDRRRLDRPLGVRVPANASRLTPHYALRLTGEDRVADRSAVEVRLEPQDTQRYGYALWFDKQTGLMLRAEVLNPAGRVIERLMVMNLDLRDAMPEALLESTLDDAGFTRVEKRWDPDTASTTQARGRWRVSNPPAGYRVSMDRLQSLPGRAAPVRHLLLTDGLANVSVYIEPAEQAPGVDGAMRMGAMNAYGRRIGQHQAIVVGEVPANTVRRIAASLVSESTPETTGQRP